MTTILLARHGQASFGQENYDRLSELGETQAKMLGQHYANTQRRIDAIFTGNLVRQQDSARHFWQGQQPFAQANNDDMAIATAINFDEHESYILPQFDEFNHKDVFVKSAGDFDNQAEISAEIANAQSPNRRLAELFDQAMQRWHGGNNDQDYIESWPQFNERAQQALEQVRTKIADMHLDQHSTVLVFTSGGVIAAITAKLLSQGSQTAYQLNKSLVNTGVTSITLKSQRAHLLSLNEYSHLFSEGKQFVTWR